MRLRVYQAAGIEVAGYDPRELEKMFKGMASGAKVTVPEVDLPDAPAKNRELVKPHAEADHGVAGDGVVRSVAGLRSASRWEHAGGRSVVWFVLIGFAAVVVGHTVPFPFLLEYVGGGGRCGRGRRATAPRRSI